MTPWYFYLLFFSSIFVVTIELLHPPVGKHKPQQHKQDWHNVKCKCGYCEDVHDVPVKKLTMH